MKFSALIMVVQAGLFICVNVLIEDYRSEQCETRVSRILKERGKIRGERRKKGEAGTYCVPADIGQSVL